MNYKNVWLSSCFGPVPAASNLINVKFRGRDYFADFPRGSFDLLVSDPMVECITDNETGEVLFSRD